MKNEKDLGADAAEVALAGSIERHAATARHTPGPWRFEGQGEGRRIFAEGERRSLMGDKAYYPWCPSDDADWMLIGAAPGLLAACKDALSELRDCFRDDCRCARHALMAAIAKAEGR